MNRKHAYLAVVAASALVLGGHDKVESFFGNSDKSGELVQRIETKKSDGSISMLLPDFAQLFEQEGQVVVNIQATKAVKSADNSEENSMDLDRFPSSDPFYEFFRRLVLNIPDMPEQDEGSDELSFGSGFIISQDGYILTNTHVVANMANIKVLLNDKHTYSIKLIGSGQRSDVALIEIDAKDLPVVEIDSPKNLKPDEWAAAIGTPFGLDNSIATGIVSVKGHSLPNENYTPFIRTDAAINPGNSGGPLFNLKGQAVGISSQIYSCSGGFMGIPFAIPIGVAMNVVDQIRKTDKVQRGQPGVITQKVPYGLAKSLGLDKAGGALMAKVMPNSPAAQAGLQVGDVVRSVNGKEVRASSDLSVMVGAVAPGKEIRLGVWRKGEKISARVQFGSVGTSVEAGGPGSSNPARQPGMAGFTVENTGLTLQVQNSDNKQRLIVTRVTGTTERTGLKHSGEVLAASQVMVDDESTFHSALENMDKNVTLLVQRNGNTPFLALNLQ